jgi:methylmalonyl-CoA mutase N-terminal domain/subunit
MYRERLWTIRQVTGYKTPVETNERLRFLTEQGETGLSVVFDQPTHFHLDSDHPLARGEVGRVGLPWDTLQDVEDTMAGIDPAAISMSLIANSGWLFLPFYLAAARRRGVPFENLRGTLQNDPILVFHSVGTFTVPLAAGMKLLTDVAEFCVKNVPGWNFVSVAGYNTREAGANAVQEAAISLASALAYARSFQERDLDPDAFLPRISFFLSAHNDFFEEIAKYRAMRRIWARMCRDELGARKERSMLMRFHTQTAGSTLTRQQPVNNVVRTSLQALAAVLGGTQSLHTNSYDEAVALPTEEAVTLAIRTQQIIALESRVPSVVDPLGGSYFVESLTNDMEQAILKMLDEIANQGGIVAASQSGWIQKTKFEEADRYFDQIESGQRPVVGVTTYTSEEESEIPVFKIDPEYETRQIGRLSAWREERNQTATAEALEALEVVAGNAGNVIEPAIEAVTAGATIGEIGDVFKRVHGEQREPNERALLS